MYSLLSVIVGVCPCLALVFSPAAAAMLPKQYKAHRTETGLVNLKFMEHRFGGRVTVVYIWTRRCQECDSDLFLQTHIVQKEGREKESSMHHSINELLFALFIMTTCTELQLLCRSWPFAEEGGEEVYLRFLYRYTFSYYEMAIYSCQGKEIDGDGSNGSVLNVFTATLFSLNICFSSGQHSVKGERGVGQCVPHQMMIIIIIVRPTTDRLTDRRKYEECIEVSLVCLSW